MRRVLLVAVALSSLFTIFQAREAAALNFGRLQLTPYVGVSAHYDDNIFTQNGGEIDDFFFVVTPGILLHMPQRDNLFEVEYNADIFRYVDTGEANDVEDHYLRGLAEINFPAGLSIRLNDRASLNHETRGESNLAVSGVTPISEYLYNDLNAEVEYRVSERFSVAAGYLNYYTDYDLMANNFRDRLDNGASATVYYRFMPKTAVLVEGVYKNVYHTDDGSPRAAVLNSDEYWAMAGLTWDITAKSTGTVKGGYEWKDFDHPASDDFQSAIYIVSLEHNFTPKTSVSINGVRQARETDDPAVSHYTTTGGTVRAGFRPLSRILIGPFGTYTYNRYSGTTTAAGDTARREDNYWAAGIDVSYEMNKWVELAAGYRHKKRSSNLPFYDYTDNEVYFSVRGQI